MTGLRLAAAAAVFLGLWSAAPSPAPASSPASSPAPVLEGDFVQGGLVVGRTMTGAVVRLDGEFVTVGRDGRFVFGFGRDAAPKAKLEVDLPGGRTIVREIEVLQRTYRIQRIDGLPPRMVTPPPEVLARIREEGEAIRTARAGFTERPEFSLKFAWPVTGRVTGVYGSQRILNGEPRQPHLGVDIAAPGGTPVRASAAGTVTLAADDLYYTGGTVAIDHGYGLSTVYSHLSDVSVKADQKLELGDVIGTVGATGRATGAHLDWRVNWYQVRLDPELLVGPMPE